MKLRCTLVAALLGCGSSTVDSDRPPLQATDSDVPEPADDTADSGDTGTTGTRDLVGAVGSVHLVDVLPNALDPGGEGMLVAVFAGEDEGILNLAECVQLHGGGPCVTSYPSIGETIIEDADRRFLLNVAWFDAGMLSVGASRVAAGFEDGRIYYEQTLASFGGSTDVSFDGDLEPFQTSDAFTWAGSLAMTSPPVTERIAVSGGEALDFRWTTGGGGGVYLRAGTAMTQLEDDGQHTLRVDDFLTLRAPVDTVIAKFFRLTRSELDAEGNDLTIQTSREQWYLVDYTSLDGWRDLVDEGRLADRCQDAGGMLPLHSGLYWADLGSFTNAHELSDGGFGAVATPAKDAVARVQLEAGEMITTRFRLAIGDPALYLLPDSCREDDAFAVETEVFFYSDEVVLRWTAEQDTEAYLVLDGLVDVDSKGALEVEIVSF